MKKLLSNLRRSNWFYVALMLVVGILSYLLLIERLGFYGDDWYIIFDGHTQGPMFLLQVSKSDRPAQGLFWGLTYALFNEHFIWYHLTSFLYRFMAALAFFWILNRIWPTKKEANFLIIFFFLLYPGYVMQFDPVVYQIHSLSQCLAMVSIALSVKAIGTKTSISKLMLWIFAGISAWIYLSLLEYFIGMEFLRLFFVVLASWHESIETVKEKVTRSIKNWFPYVVVPVGFLIWRIFFFESTRKATDIAAQIGVFTSAPSHTALWWLVNALYSMWNIIFSAWVVPFSGIFIQLRLRDILLTFGISAVCVSLILFGLYWRTNGTTKPQEEEHRQDWIPLVMWGGFVSILIGIAPVILANRYVDFEYSRYTLVGAAGAVMILVAGLYLFSSQRLRILLTSILVFVAVSTQFGISLNLVDQADSLRNFWWQVSWRAPQIEPGTTLVASYSLMAAPEEYDIWGPANLIYYPEKQDTTPIKIQLPAAILGEETVNLILGRGNGGAADRRGNLIDVGFGSMLVMAQSSPNSCVRILDGLMPELSLDDENSIKLISPFSQIDRIMTNATPSIPPEAFFGPEPEHGWCFYYQKASLARQNGDWQTVITLGNEARTNGFSPYDRIEWIPFLQAYVAMQQIDKLEAYSGVMNEFPLIRFQTCQILKQTASETHPDDFELKMFIEEKFCPYE